jgi:hypothetical protein
MYPREYFDTYWRPELKNEVFVIMSFAPEWENVWTQAIRPAVEQDTLGQPFAHRVDATTLAGSIITEILDGIAHAKLVFADVSVCSSGRWAGQRNGNAMYELGLAHALRPASELVVVRSDTEQINFDIAGIKIQSYDRDDLPIARQTFARLLGDRLADLNQVKHLKTIQAVESLDADCLNLLASTSQNDFFSVTPAKTMGEVMAEISSGTKDAVRHLLALGIIRFDANTSAGAHAYHWTGFGCAVLRKLGLR